MANQAITVNTNHDALTGRLAGEDIAIQLGAVLTIDSMPHLTVSGILGLLTITRGTLHIDGRKVREVTYNTGSGAMPTAIPTNVSWTGGTGKIIRYNSGTNVSGTITLTVLTGVNPTGTITDGTWSATVATDKVGFMIVYGEDQDWVSVNADSSIKINGDWHELGVGTGLDSQVLTLPHTGHQPAIWVETGSGTGIFQIWHRVVPSASTIFWNNISQFGTTFESGFVFDQSFGSATVTFGTSTAGGVPPNGARIRIPNVHIGTTSVATPTTEVSSATITVHIRLITPNVNVNVEIDHLNGSSIQVDFIGTNAVSCEDSCWGLHTNDILINKVNAPILIENCAIIDGAPGVTGSYLPSNVLQITDNIGGITITDCVIFAGENGGTYGLGLVTMANLDFKGVCKIVSNQQDENTMYALRGTTASNITAETLIVLGGPAGALTSANDWTIDELIFGLPPGRGTTEQNMVSAFYHAASKGLTIQSGRLATGGAKFGTSDIFTLVDSDTVTIRSFGDVDAKINCGARATFVVNMSGISTNIRLQRLWFTNNLAAESFLMINSCADITIENCSGAYNDELELDATRVLVKGLHGASGNLDAADGVEGDLVNVLATIFLDYFKSDTTGAVGLLFNDRGVKHLSDVQIVTGSPVWNGLGDLLMRTAGDQVIYTFPYFIKGHTAFQNIAIQLSGTLTGNLSYEYRLDTGSGFSGSFKTCNATNLSGETISPAGFRLQIQITCVTGAATNAIQGLGILTTTTIADQKANFYPLDVVPITIEVIDANTKSPVSGAAVFIETDPGGVQLIKTTTDVNGIVSFDYELTGTSQDIVGRVRKSTSAPYYKTGDIVGTITSAGYSVTILLIPD